MKKDWGILTNLIILFCILVGIECGVFGILLFGGFWGIVAFIMGLICISTGILYIYQKKRGERGETRNEI